MKRTHWLLVAILSLVTAPVLAMNGNINGFIGQKSLDSDWDPVEDQVEIGVVADFRNPAWPISIATDLFYSWDDSSTPAGDIDGMTLELDVGVRKVFDMSSNPVHPYVGGGLALVMADIDGPGGSDDDTGAGYWAGVGVMWTLANHMNLGLDVRYSDAEVTLHRVDVNGGGTHYGILVGYQW